MLKQYQGKSECPIKKDEFDIIENEIREQELTYNLIKGILRKYKMAKYYEYVPFILKNTVIKYTM